MQPKLDRFTGAWVAFRVDWSRSIGAGHLMRCMTLASALSEIGIPCCFFAHTGEGMPLSFVFDAGHDVVLLPKVSRKEEFTGRYQHSYWLPVSPQHDADRFLTALSKFEKAPVAIVVDHYALDREWIETVCGKTNARSLTIDDLADRPLGGDIILNQNLTENLSDLYERVLPTPHSTKLLLGPEFSLLRPQFSEHRNLLIQNNLLTRRGPIKKIAVTLGTVDAEIVTVPLLKSALPLLTNDMSVSVAAGSTTRNMDTLKSFARKNPSVTLSIDHSDMASFFGQADVGIGAAGSTNWERCCLGLPTIVLVVAKNQLATAKALAATRAASIGFIDGIIPNSDSHTTPVLTLLDELIKSPQLLTDMSLAAQAITDGSGAAKVSTILAQGLRP